MVWLPTFRLVDLSTFRLVGKLAGQTERGTQMGDLRAQEQKDREGAAVYRERTQERAHQKQKKGVGTPAFIFPL